MDTRLVRGSLGPATVLLFTLAASPAALAATLSVGPGKTYATPCQAVSAAADNDVIEIDAAGNYDGDVCAIPRSGLTLRGVGGRAKIDAAGKSAGGKAIWVIQGDDTVVEDIEFSGATVPDQNGAGIRQEGVNLTVRGCYFHDNDDGILAGDKQGSTIVIEYTEFANNGFGDGQSHNVYINRVDKLVFQYNYSHHAKVGHLLKTRALENHILYNRLTGEDGNSSYEIDVPSGGKTILLGNLIQQGPSTDNGGIITYAVEGATNPSTSLFVVNNTVVNDRPNGGTFVNIASGVAPAVVRNNLFVGPGTIVTQQDAVQEGNVQGDAMFVDKAGFDYRLQVGSPAVDKGVPPGEAEGFDLTPRYHYVHPASAVGRMTVDTVDVGAYELGGDVEGGGAGVGGGGVGGGGVGGGGAGGDGPGGGTPDGGGAGGGTSSGGHGADAGEEGGCGCRVAGAGRGAGAGWLALAALASIAALRSYGRRVTASATPGSRGQNTDDEAAPK
ncbi:right-handed parallel beta-helix repeat-containing protein [Sorangium sp. So ce854]|uniref:right-handed parallel beta-helix repeat-containing protein n=1 Tax=Sorangium sp. So ce854 TaxID=3133322 RepID=UPI003F60A013